MSEPNYAGISEEKQNSVTLKKDSKGNYNWEVKLYFAQDEQLKALKELEGINEVLKATYNKEDGN